MATVALTHKIRLDPTCKQEAYFRRACGTARFVWNWGLAEWKRQYEAGEKPSGLKLKKQFNSIKSAQYPWIYEVTKYAAQQPFLFLQTAFNRFFQKEAKYPRFKKKGVHDSFYIGNDHFDVAGTRIRIPKLGWVNMREKLRFCGKLVSATISRTADKWFVSITVVMEQPPQVCKNQASVGVDLGINRLATLSTGIVAEGPKPLKAMLKKLNRLQRRLSRKQKSSNNRHKARVKVARLHFRISCIRADALHKLTTALVQTFGHIVIEDLNVKGMMANGRLARHIADMGFHEFRRQLEYKTAWNGSQLHVADRWFPSSKRCSKCGSVNHQLKLSDRQFSCHSCHLNMDRDLNAAINLNNTVSSTGFQACGEEGAGLGISSGETVLDEAGTRPCTDLCTS